METGYDIIFFWVARMMMGIHFLGEPPFETVYLHGMVKDRRREDVQDEGERRRSARRDRRDRRRRAPLRAHPRDLPGNDQKFSQEKLENARNFANKLWNATRYVVGARPATIPADSERRLPVEAHLGPAERWLLSRAAGTIEAVDGAMAGYAFGEVTRLLYEAIWSEFCDWGLELAKVRLADESLPAEDREATWWALVESLDALLRLLHPFLPFLTEAIWAATPHGAADPELLIVDDWPRTDAWDAARDAAAEAAVDGIRNLVTEVRNARSTARIAPSEWRAADVHVPAELGATFDALVPSIGGLPGSVRSSATCRARRSRGSWPGSLAVIAVISGIRGGWRDRRRRRAAERARPARARRSGGLRAARARLANEAQAKAPPAVVRRQGPRGRVGRAGRHRAAPGPVATPATASALDGAAGDAPTSSAGARRRRAAAPSMNAALSELPLPAERVRQVRDEHGQRQVRRVRGAG